MKSIDQIERDAELAIIKQRVIHLVKLGDGDVRRQYSAEEWSEIKQLGKRTEELKP